MRKPSLKFIVLAAMLSIGCVKNTAPDAPTISGSREAHPGQPRSFQIQGIDTDLDSLQYLVDWRDSSVISPTNYVASGSIVAITHTYANSGTYPIRVLSVDMAGDTSAWSSEHRFDVFQKIERLWFQTSTHAPHYCEFPKPPAQGMDGTDYVVFSTELMAVNSSGLQQWSFSDSGRLLTCSAVAEDGTIYVGTAEGKFIALNPNGTTHWTYTTSGVNQLTPCAIAKDGTIYFGSMDSFFYALTPDGQLKWKHYVNNGAGGTPAIGPSGDIYFTVDGGKLFCLDPDGICRWTTQLSYGSGSSQNQSAAISGNEQIYLVTNSLYAVSKEGIVEWLVPFDCTNLLNSVRNVTIGLNGTIYAANNSFMLAISSDGSILWKYPYLCEGSPAITQSGSMVLTMHGELHTDEVYIFTAEGNACSRTDSMGVSYIGNAPLIDHNGVIYVVGIYPAQQQFLYAVQGNSPLANTDWPMYQHDPQHTGRAGD